MLVFVSTTLLSIDFDVFEFDPFPFPFEASFSSRSSPLLLHLLFLFPLPFPSDVGFSSRSNISPSWTLSSTTFFESVYLRNILVLVVVWLVPILMERTFSPERRMLEKNEPDPITTITINNSDTTEQNNELLLRKQRVRCCCCCC